MQAGGEPDAPLPDAALIDASRRGDSTAFAQIIERYQRAVYAVSFSQLRDRALADDIAQDTFVTAWRRIGDLRDPERLPAWLCGIARNHARDTRKLRRREHADAEMIDIPAHATPFDALSDAESDRLIAVALEAIPDAYREPLVLFYYEQHSVDEVARLLGISAATTHKRLSRGRQYLADHVSTIVERDLARRGPKRELVASVLAVIGIASTASHVDASPAPKGATMPVKLTLIATIAVLAVAAGMLSADVIRARPAARPAPAPAAKPAAPPTTTTSSARPRATTPQPARTRAPAAPALVSPPPPVVPDCKAVGAHMGALSIAQAEAKGPLPTKKHVAFGELLGERATKRCIVEQWSENMRICIVDADHYSSAINECTDAPVATAAEVAALPPELACDVLAQHFYTLLNAPDAKFGIIKKKVAASAPADVPQIERLVLKLRDSIKDECEQRPWSIEHRRCIATSKTHAATDSCRSL